MATAEFSKFAGILSAALSQHHLLGFEITQIGIPSPPLALFVVILPKAHLTLAWGTTNLCLRAGIKMNTGKPGGQTARQKMKAGREEVQGRWGPKMGSCEWQG